MIGQSQLAELEWVGRQRMYTVCKDCEVRAARRAQGEAQAAAERAESSRTQPSSCTPTTGQLITEIRW